ncbi:MAG: DNA-processing protein DprA [Oscillospiraceae bacterium]|nr:DNA-processing protein DprA [Oscillospiraceae bacterium]
MRIRPFQALQKRAGFTLPKDGDKMEYWIWLQHALGAGARADDIISYFGSPREFFEAGKREWILSGVVSRDTAQKLENTPVADSLAVMEECRKNNWQVITVHSEAYPDRLREISAFPLVLYVWGDVSVLREEVPVAFVGTRSASRYGLDVSYRLAYGVAEAGAIVVSGGAIGIDSSSHRGALAAGGKTIAVLGCGLGYPYLKQNEDLRRDIAKNGAVISEFPPSFAANRTTFPIRNRLISGISLGTVIIEAGIKSGSLITARCAYRQGRDVFAVPGDIITSNYTGANKLIRDGAKPVFAPCDILNEYAHLYPKTIRQHRSEQSTLPQKAPENKKISKNGHNNGFSTNIYNDKDTLVPAGRANRPLPEDLHNEVKMIYSFLKESPKTADSLSDESGMAIARVLSCLTELEMRGYASRNESGLFAAVN